MPPGVNNNNIVRRKVGINPAGHSNGFQKHKPFRPLSTIDCHYFGKNRDLLARKQRALSSEMNGVYVIDFGHGVIDVIKEMGIGIWDLLKFASAVEVKTKEFKMLLLKALISKGARERLKEICVGITAISRNSIEIIDDLIESVNSESAKNALREYKNRLLNGDEKHSAAYYQGRFAVEVVLWAPVIYGLVFKGARIAGKAAKGLAELGGKMKGLVKLPKYVREGELAGTGIRVKIWDFVRDERGSFSFKRIPSVKRDKLTRFVPPAKTAPDGLKIVGEFKNISRPCKDKMKNVINRLNELKKNADGSAAKIEKLEEELTSLFKTIDSGKSSEIDKLAIEGLDDLYKNLNSGRKIGDLNFGSIEESLGGLRYLSEEALEVLLKRSIQSRNHELVAEIRQMINKLKYEKEVPPAERIAKLESEVTKAEKAVAKGVTKETSAKSTSSKLMPKECQDGIQSKVQEYAKSNNFKYEKEIDKYAPEIAKKIKDKEDLIKFLKRISYEFDGRFLFKTPVKNKEPIIRILLKWARGTYPENKMGNHAIQSKLGLIQQLGIGETRILILKDGKMNKIFAIGDKNSIRKIYKLIK